jgi:hypothetical protein
MISLWPPVMGEGAPQRGEVAYSEPAVPAAAGPPRTISMFGAVIVPPGEG